MRIYEEQCTSLLHTHEGSKKLFTEDCTNINSDSGIEIPEAWNKTVFKKLKKKFCSETFNERISTGNRVP